MPARENPFAGLIQPWLVVAKLEQGGVVRAKQHYPADAMFDSARV